MTSAQPKAMITSELADEWWSPATNAQLKAMTPDELAEEVYWSAAKRFPWRWSRMATREFPVLLINDPTHTLMQRVIRDQSWRGLAIRPREVAQAIERLKGIRRLSARGKEMIYHLTEYLRWNRHVGICLVQDGPDRQCRDRIVLHERFHLLQYRKRLQKRSAANALIRQPSTSKALPYLRKHGYDVDDAVMIVSEMAAYIFSGDHAFIGLRRREAERWLSAYFRQHGVRRPFLQSGENCQ